ncbi:MAG: hypothetical protein JWO09_2717 [Bacteroidetes bacterium]|nr:hypothetical protein [Bacteroidota bacterium]
MNSGRDCGFFFTTGSLSFLPGFIIIAFGERIKFNARKEDFIFQGKKNEVGEVDRFLFRYASCKYPNHKNEKYDRI